MVWQNWPRYSGTALYCVVDKPPKWPCPFSYRSFPGISPMCDISWIRKVANHTWYHKQGKHNGRLFTHSLNSTAVTFVDLLIVVHLNHSIFKMPRQRSSSWQMKKLSNQCVTIWIAELWITNDKTIGEIGVWYFFCRRRMKRHPTRGTSLGTGIMLHRQYMRIMQKYRVQRIRLRLYFRGNIRSQKWNKYDFLLNDVGN